MGLFRGVQQSHVAIGPGAYGCLRLTTQRAGDHRIASGKVVHSRCAPRVPGSRVPGSASCKSFTPDEVDSSGFVAPACLNSRSQVVPSLAPRRMATGGFRGLWMTAYYIRKKKSKDDAAPSVTARIPTGRRLGSSRSHCGAWIADSLCPASPG